MTVRPTIYDPATGSVRFRREPELRDRLDCARKRRFAHDWEARSCLLQFQPFDKSLTIYRCPVPECGGWHLGHRRTP